MLPVEGKRLRQNALCRVLQEKSGVEPQHCPPEKASRTARADRSLGRRLKSGGCRSSPATWRAARASSLLSARPGIRNSLGLCRADERLILCFSALRLLRRWRRKACGAELSFGVKARFASVVGGYAALRIKPASMTKLHGKRTDSETVPGPAAPSVSGGSGLVF